MKRKIYFLAAFIGSSIMFGVDAQISTSVTGNNSDPFVFNKPLSCDGVLDPYKNEMDAGNGFSSQEFEAENEAYNNELADDFVAPPGASKICNLDIVGTVSAGGFGSDPDSGVTVRIYEDDGGFPGTELWSQFYPGSEFGNTDSFSITNFDSSPVLVGGQTYWLTVQAKMSFALGGQWYWQAALDDHDNIFMWRNPGDGFGTGCVEWSPGPSCLQSGEALSLMLNIEFNEFLDTSELAASNLSIYPNPADSYVNILAKNGAQITGVQVFDLTGRGIPMKLKDGKIDISKLTPGTYVLSVMTNKGPVAQKLIKK